MNSNKKELVIITNICYPICSAVGNLSLKCAEYLSEKYNIRIISLQDGNYSINGEEINDFKIYTVSQKIYKNYFVFRDKLNNNNNKIKRIYYFIMFITSKIIMYVERKFLFMDNRWWFEKEVNKVLNNLWIEKKFDAILSVSSPIGSHISAMKFKKKHPEIFWVSYWGDLFSGKNFKQNILIPHVKYIELENKIINNSDYVMATSEIYDEFLKRNNCNKLERINYVLKEDILNICEKNKVTKNERPLIICMGSFQSKVRNPEYMLKIFNKLSIKYDLELYTSGCEEIILKYINKNVKNIKFMGRVKYEDLKKRLKDANFLINIGNSLSSSVPSKIFELISYCKPIIDFYYLNNRLEILDNYPIIIRIEMNNNDDALITDLEEFIVNNQNENISTSKIREIFGDYSENIIKEKINNIFERK